MNTLDGVRNRLENIEFLRIIFIVCILIHHFALFINSHFLHTLPIFNSLEFVNFSKVTENGLHYCDCFFIIAGFFLVYTLKEKVKFCDFVKNKIIRLYPLIPFVFIIYYIYSKFGFVKFTSYYDLTSLFLINNIGITRTLGNNGHLWFVSALFWASLLYVYIIKNYEKKNTDLFVLSAVFFCYAFLFYADFKHLGHHVRSIYFIFNPGLMRAIGGMGIGYLIANWYKNSSGSFFNTKNDSIFSKFIYTLLEFYLLVSLLKYTMFKFNPEVTPLTLIIYFTLLFILFVFSKGYLSSFLNKIKFSFISKYVYSVYIVHFCVFIIYWQISTKIYYEFIPDNIIIFAILYIIVCFIFGVIAYYKIEKPIGIFMRNFLYNTEREVESATNNSSR